MHAFDADWQELVEPFPPGYAWTPEDGLIKFASAVPDELEPLPPRAPTCGPARARCWSPPSSAR